MRECLYKVSIDETREILMAMVSDGLERKKRPSNVFVYGTMGVGKSSTIEQLSNQIENELGLRTKVIDIRLSGMESADVLGIAYVDKDGSREMTFSTPSWWPKDDDGYDYYILFLDEVPNAAKEVMKAAYRLVLDRSIQNGKVLPDNVMIIGTGNLPEDGTGARELLPALANRFSTQLIIDTEQVCSDFPQYAYENDFHIDVVSYLKWKPENSVGKPNESAFNTPRSWEYVSNHLKNPYLSESLRAKCICGAVGSAIGSEFLAYRALNVHIPDFDMIIQRKIQFNLPAENNIQFAILTPLASRIQREFKDGNTENAVTLITECLDKFGDDLCIIAIRILRQSEEMQAQILTNPALRSIFERTRSKMAR